MQAPGVGMGGLIENFIGGAGLHDAPGVEDDDALGQSRHHAHVVGDEQHRGAAAFLHLADQVQNLGLNGHVQRRGGLIGNEESRLAGQRRGDHHTLAHTAGELVGIAVQGRLRVRDANQRQHLRRLLQRLLAADLLMEAVALGDLMTDLHGGVQGSHGVLKDHGGVPAPIALPLLLAVIEDVLPVAEDLAAGLAASAGDLRQAHEGAGRHGFAAAGFSHQRHALALIHVEADAPHCLHHATAGGEVDAEVTDVVLMHDLPPGIGAEAAAEAVAQHIEAQNGQQDAQARIDRQ